MNAIKKYPTIYITNITIQNKLNFIIKNNKCGTNSFIVNDKHNKRRKDQCVVFQESNIVCAKLFLNVVHSVDTPT